MFTLDSIMTGINTPQITVISPTTGKESLSRLIGSLRKQSIPYTQVLLWDDGRDEKAGDPLSYEDHCTQSVIIKGRLVQGIAPGSALRAIGLMVASTPYVTFADDDVWFDDDHFESLMSAVKGRNWAFSLRKIYSPAGEYIGVDRFESVGEQGKTPHKMVDNNSNLFKREFGVGAAHLYRETRQYNDDRLMYAFLKKHAGRPGKTKRATVNHLCPPHLEQGFRNYCSAE